MIENLYISNMHDRPVFCKPVQNTPPRKINLTHLLTYIYRLEKYFKTRLFVFGPFHANHIVLRGEI